MTEVNMDSDTHVHRVEETDNKQVESTKTKLNDNEPKNPNEEGETEKIITKKVTVTKNISSSSKKEKYPCPLCSKEFQNKSGRYNHIRLHHKVKLDFGKVHCLEAGCLFSCTYTTVLQQHLTAVHNIPMKYLHLEFDNYDEFEKWKHNFETGEVCRFVKKSGSRVGDSGKSMYLYCSRSGTFVSHSQGRRNKKLGSAKISAHCTALIKYFEESSGRVNATVCSTHYGHDRDHRFLRLTKVQKRQIADKMKSGMSRELVLDSIRSTFVNKLDRIHELSKKDLNNIQKCYNIPKAPSEPRKSSNANTTMFNPLNLLNECWISDIDISVDSPVLLYKEGKVDWKNLKSEDKCLILMTKGQRDLFVKFCNNGILYVTTLRLSSTLPLHLIVIFVLDDFYEMFPVCFMISNDIRADALKVCFNEILSTIGPIALRAFATDNQPYIFEAWCDVMGPTLNLTIANRYVDTEWRTNLTAIENEALQGEVYDKLYEFIETIDGTEEKFESLIAELKSSHATTTFAAYLEKNFLSNIRSWSTHYLKELTRLREPIDFEISFSKIANICELCCKYNKSVGYVAKALIKLLIESLANRNRRVAEQVDEINNAHAASIPHGTKCVFPLRNHSWKVTSDNESKNFYNVVAEQCNFDNCVLTCGLCEMCVHAFRCTCDGYIDSKTCVHVHLVATMVKNSGTNAHQHECDKMLRNLDDTNELVVDIDECTEDTELRQLRVETQRILDDVSKKLANFRDESNLSRVHALVKDVQGNVDVMLKYGCHVKDVKFVVTSKPATKKKTKKPVVANTKRTLRNRRTIAKRS